MIELPLSQNKVALIDDEDETRVRVFRWVAMRRVNGDWYAGRHPKRENGRWGTEYLHQFILNSGGRRIDHINHNGLDCRKDNMRFCTHAENMRNRVKRNPSTTSRFKGVSLYPTRGLWRATIFTDGRLIDLGYFVSEIDAASAYDAAAKTLFGEFCFLNFKEPEHGDCSRSLPVNEIGDSTSCSAETQLAERD